MNTSTPAAPSSLYTLNTLEDTPRRALELLRGIGSSPAILKLMMKAGYSEVSHDEGQRLLASVVAFINEKQVFTSSSHVQAVTALETFERTAFRRLRAVTERFFPEQVDSLFGGLKISDEMDATLLAKIFLERLALTGSKTRKGMSHIAKVFAERGFGPAETRELEKAVKEAGGSGTDASEEADKVEVAEQKETRLAKLTELRAWYDDWSETARVVLDRRDHQIRVGLARRKVHKGTTPVPPIVVPSAPPAAPVAPTMPVMPADSNATTPANDNVTPIVKVA